MRVPRLVLLPLACLIALVVVGFVFSSSQAAADVPAAGQQVSLPPGANTGAPAITPRSDADIAFSASDVRAFIQAHGFIGGPVVSGHTLQILSIQLMTPQQANAQGADLTGYAAKMVYAVKMKGPFLGTNVKGISPGIQTYLIGYEIFDAHTGNMLEWGATQSVDDGI